MRIVTVPQGTIALVGEYTAHKYTSTSGAEGFSYGANMAAYGSSTGLTEDQVSTLASEAVTRRNGLINDVASQVEADLADNPPSSEAPSGSWFWALIIGAVLLILAIVVVPLLVAAYPGAATTQLGTVDNFLIGAGAVLIGYAISPRAIRRPRRQAHRAPDETGTTTPPSD